MKSNPPFVAYKDARAGWRLITRKTLFISFMSPLFLGSTFFFGLRWFESAVTFHPARYEPGEAWSLPQGGKDVWFKTADNVRLHGWFINSHTKPVTATIIYFHGNGGNLSNVKWIGEGLAAHGFDVLLFDYRGYGRSESEVSDERGLYGDADAAYDYVVNERGVAPRRLVLYGQSLGTTAVVDVASRKACGAIILESGVSSASDMAARMLPWLPRWTHSLARNRFDSVRKLPSVRCPVLITHGDPDHTIPLEQGRALYAAANEPKKLVVLPGAGHNVSGFGGKNYLNSIAQFAREAISAS